MGQSSSSTLPAADPKLPYFSLTFQTPDKITLSLADNGIIALTRTAILDSSHACGPKRNGQSRKISNSDSFIHYEGRTEINAYVFKLRGLPFMRGCGRVSSLRVTRMCCSTLEKYYEQGWRLVLCSDLSRAKELTTWFFHRIAQEERIRVNEDSAKLENEEALEKRQQRSVICVSTSSSDLIQLTNAPRSMWRLLAQAVVTAYGINGIKVERVTEEDEYEIQLADAPWATQDPHMCVRTRRLLLEIIRRFETVGYQFYGSANTKGKSDSLFFISSANGIEPVADPPTLLGHPAMRSNPSDGSNSHSYFAISLNNSNCLRLIDAPLCVVKCVLRAIITYWPPRVKNLTTTCDKNAYEFELGGNPWLGIKSEEATAARVFLCGLLESVKALGWETLAALDVTRRTNDKAVFIFRSSFDASGLDQTLEECKDVSERSLAQPYWCLSMQNQSTIRLIGAPEYLHNALRYTIEQMWPWGIQSESSVSDFKDSYEFKLRSGPWGAEEQNTASLMCCVLKTLNDRGYRVALSADVTGRFVSNNHGGSHSLDVHSWFVACQTRGHSEQEKAASDHPIKAKLPRRRSLPLMQRSAAFADEFSVSIEPGVTSTCTDKQPPNEKEKVRKVVNKARVARKISAITDYTSRFVTDKL